MLECFLSEVSISNTLKISEVNRENCTKDKDFNSAGGFFVGRQNEISN